MVGRFSRRSFLRGATLAAAGVAAPLRAVDFSNSSRRRGGLIDVNVSLSRWPFRRLPNDDVRTLVERLRGHGVVQAWAGTFDGLLHKDLASANTRLAEKCRRLGRGVLEPFGSVNPTLPDWEEELRRCHETHHMPGIRLHPGYHGYKLDDPVFARLLDLAAGREMVVQIAISMEDERMQHPFAQVPHVAVAPLVALLESRPQVRVVLLNWFRAVRGELLQKLASAGQVFFEIATVEGVGGVGNLLEQVPAERVLFGSHAPFFYFESALLKLRESQLNENQRTGITAENARRVWMRA